MLALLAAALLTLTTPGPGQRVEAEARVTVSNGRHFDAAMRYAGPDDADYVRRTSEGETRYSVSEDGVWIAAPGKPREQGDPAMAVWVLSHNFHAQLLDFDRINGGSQRIAATESECDCEEWRGNRAAPALGIEGLSLVVQRSGRARKLLVRRKDMAPVIATFDDWRPVDGRELPFAVRIDDGKDVYEFRFSRVTLD